MNLNQSGIAEAYAAVSVLCIEAFFIIGIWSNGERE